jgi:hypothetical protein
MKHICHIIILCLCHIIILCLDPKACATRDTDAFFFHLCECTHEFVSVVVTE